MRFFVLIFAFVLAGALIAPAFLVYSHRLDKVDCVIVMVGGKTELRIRGAEQIVEQGRAGALLIPAYHKVAFAEGTGIGVRKPFGLDDSLREGDGWMKRMKDEGTVAVLGRRFQVFENTHLELMMGKEMMDKLGFRSAIIVSSPYHMLRLKLIVGRLFNRRLTQINADGRKAKDNLSQRHGEHREAKDGKRDQGTHEKTRNGNFGDRGRDYRIGFEATPFEKYGVLSCFRSWKDFGNVVSEYIKIAWFLVYAPF